MSSGLLAVSQSSNSSSVSTDESTATGISMVGPLMYKSYAVCALSTSFLSFLTGHFFPLAGAGGFEDGVADVLGFEGVAEGWGGGFAGLEAFDEVGDLMDEGVFVADLQAGHPPVFHVGMLAVGDVD